MRYFGLALIFIFGTAGQAYADPLDNIFGADLSHPDLELSVKSFEQICMPFVLHKTELTREMGKAHWAETLAVQGYELSSTERVEKRYIVEPHREEWKPETPALDASTGKFTVFDGASDRVVTSIPPTGEIDMRAFVPAKHETMLTDVETFEFGDEERLSAVLDWNILSKNSPGKSCEIIMERPQISLADFTENFIQKDVDWTSKDDGWSQCVKDGEDEFLFSVSYQTEELTLSVRRSDFWEPKPCGSRHK